MIQYIIISIIIILFVILNVLLILYPNQRSDYIPLNIWQTYKSDNLPEKAKKCQSSWTRQKHYQYQFMDDGKIETFMKENFSPKIIQTFKRMPLGVMKADMWRYCVLYIHGGIYSDIDSVSIKPIEEWKIQEEDRIIIGLENDLHFCQWTIISEPKHPILKTVIQLIVDEAEKGFDLKNEHFVHHHTGPGIWTRAIQQTLGLPEDQKAQLTYDAYKDTNSEVYKKAKSLGIRFENEKFFSENNVKNLYGSTQFDDGYSKWMDERDKILKNA